MAAIQLSPLEIASGLVLGEGRGQAAITRPRGGVKPRVALEQAILPLLHRAPCVVSFSGGRDSSAMLAMAAGVARREQLPAPVPATLRFGGDPDSEESRWQELVVDELGLDDWQRIEAGEELGVLGRVARAALERHGLLWPPNIHVLVPLLEAARGGSLITGVGGDELFAGLPRLRRALLPAPVRRARARRRASIDLPWLRAPARSALRSAVAGEEAAKPVRWRSWVPWVARRRQFDVLVESGEALALDAEVELAHPFLDPGLLVALREHAPHPRGAARTAFLHQLLEGLLPKAVLSRTEKADFTRALWGAEVGKFAAAWSGEGPPGELVDAARLRQVWSDERPDFRSATALQAAWRAEAQSGASLVGSGQRRGVAPGRG